MLAIARDNVSRDIRTLLRPEMEAVLQALTAALREQAHEAATGLKAVDDSTPDRGPGQAPDRSRGQGPDGGRGQAYEERYAAIHSSLDALQAREHLVLNQQLSADAAAVANVAAFNQGLHTIGERLLHRPLGYVYGLAFPKEHEPAATRSGGFDQALTRYSAKLGSPRVLGYVVGVASHRGELGVIVWTAIIAGLPTYGATMRKMILRIVGGVIGGLLALLS